ncbi:hypothetical protein EYF80_022608 [Liparis tanakae]|uniref:Uncharacterized protein n=1 Tax=Liparis tanakae TaxID=230148 RepID=A0A4Z2HNQ6_9TELE|nr:hypothetical protein EYF80_022608 [Liparis tanakae]
MEIFGGGRGRGRYPGDRGDGQGLIISYDNQNAREAICLVLCILKEGNGQEGLADRHDRQRFKAFGDCGKSGSRRGQAFRASSNMATTVGARQHSDTVVCVRSDVRYGDVQIGSIGTAMGDAGFWEADLVAVDFSIGNKRRRPCYLKHKQLMPDQTGLIPEATPAPTPSPSEG